MTLDDKIKRTKQLIMEWYAQFNGKVYVSFSGGKDSTVLLHIARNTLGCSDIVGVFDDTGLEYPEIRQFVKQQDNIIWIKPKLSFKQVIDKYGYPVISKEQSRYIFDLRSEKASDRIKNIRLNGWYNDCGNTAINMLKINWHDKTEIKRPIQEATEADLGKLCKFWDSNPDCYSFGIMTKILYSENAYYKDNWTLHKHCRRLTKQEIEELC